MAMPCTLASFLASALSLPTETLPVLHSVLHPKFSLAIVAASMKEAIATALYQCAAAAYQLREDQLAKCFAGIGLVENRMAEADLGAEQLGTVCRGEIEKVGRRLVGEGADVFEEAAKKYHVRVRVYTFTGPPSQLLYPSDLPRYLTCYICLHSSKAAMLIPRKQVAALHLKSPTGAKLRTAVFVSERLANAPTVDPQLQAEMNACGQLLTLAQSLNTPLLVLSVEVLKWLLSTKHAEHAELKDRVTKKMSAIVVQLEGAELGREAQSALQELKALLPREFCKCFKCGQTHHLIQLPCSHLFCSSCFESSLPYDFLTVAGATRVPLTCPQCRKEMSIAEFRQRAEDLFCKKVNDAEQKSGLRHCKNCRNLHSLTAFPKTECGHCAFCLSQKAGECQTCKSGIADTMEFQCEGCNTPFPYKYAAGFTCTVTDGDSVHVGHSERCNNCLLRSFHSGTCCERRSLQDAEKRRIDAGIKVLRMDCHAKMERREDLAELGSCGHAVCTKCVLDTYKSNGGVFSCPACSIPFSSDVSTRLATCSVCNELRSDLSLGCGHHVHTRCVGAIVSACSHDNCAKCVHCNRYIPPSPLLTQIQPSSPSFFAFNDAFGYSFTFKCRKPGGHTLKMNDTALSVYTVECTCHKQLMCPFCGEDWDEREHQCTYVAARTMVDQMMANGQAVTQCPACQCPTELTPSEYNLCVYCGSYFAPCCSALYEPIYYHGAGWHRPDCAKFDIQGQGIGGGCSECQRNQQECVRPNKLMRPRLIGPGEVLKQSG